MFEIMFEHNFCEFNLWLSESFQLIAIDDKIVHKEFGTSYK